MEVYRVDRLALEQNMARSDDFMFVGHADVGQNLAILYSLVATCEVHRVNSYAYLADVLW